MQTSMLCPALGVRIIALAAICGMVLSGCSKPDESATATDVPAVGGKKLTIAVIPKGSTHEFWKSIHEGADKAAQELGVTVIFKGPQREDDRESQVKTVEDFITSKVDGIVLAPLDENALRGPVKEATGKKIPVVIIDSALSGGGTTSFVATDSEKAGHTAGEQLIKLLNGKGKVVMLRYEEGSASTEAREKGFLAAIATAPGITVVSSNQFGGATVETAQKASENLLAPLKVGGTLTINGIYTPNESTTFGMLRVLEDAKLAGKVKFVGFDASAKLLEALKAGEIDGLMVQDPRKIGYLGVKTLVDSIRGKKVDAVIDTGATYVTKDNMATPENTALLALPKN